MKKILFLLLAVLLAFSLTSCKKEDNLTIGISKIVSHPALDALEQGMQDAVLQEYPEAIFDLQNANGEISTASSIAQKFNASKVDLAVGIATPTAQALVQTLRDIPVVFSAVTDPVGAGLVTSLDKGEGNVTGISDMTPVFEQIQLLQKVAGIKSLGHVYSSGEANAVVLAELAKDACEKLGIEFIGTTVTNSAEVKQATQAIINRCDAIYVSTDNTVVSALTALADVATQAGIPIFSADPTSVAQGQVFMAWGFDYYKMGLASGRMVIEILQGANPDEMPTRFMTSAQDIDLYINLDVADTLGFSVPQDLQDAASTLIKNGENING
ncbi:MAG: ABC transporter substrate-binding protein [Spirochaetaceae bacterium]|jgi:putative ABC transport system substrate-binding protein|nr:ABC transporter substrate-binding protein [Spirochaetaceae bacterium]